MLDKSQARAVLEQLFKHTHHYATALINDSEQGTTRFANSEISQNVHIANTEVSLTVYDGKREATCSTNVLTDEGLRKLAEDAEHILPFVPEGLFEIFPVSEEEINETVNDDRLAVHYDVKKRAEYIKSGVATLKEGYTAAGALTLDRSSLAFGNNRGTFRFAAFDGVQFNTVVTHTDSSAGSSESAAFKLEDLDIPAAFGHAKDLSERMHNPVPIDLGVYTVVLSPVAFCDLLSYAVMPLNAKWVDDGNSYAIGKLGERVFGENITVRDDFHFPGTQPLYFDFEGNPRQAVTMIENGVIKQWLYDNKMAARHNTQTTGHAFSNKGYGGYPFNMVMEGGSQTLAEIIAGTEKGIYINEFHYSNFVNPRALQVTGLTRNGTFLIENGKLGRAVSTVRFTQSLIEALNQVTAISKERVKVNGFPSLSVVPAVKIEGFHFTSKQ